jgi:hypothetical protein
MWSTVVVMPPQYLQERSSRMTWIRTLTQSLL